MPRSDAPRSPQRPSPFVRLAGTVCARPRSVVLAFVLVLAALGTYAAGAAGTLRAGGLDIPGSESDRAARKLAGRFGTGAPHVIAVLHHPEGDVRTAHYASVVLDGIERLLEDPAVAGVTSHYDTGLASLVSRDGHRTLLLVHLDGGPAERQQAFLRLEPTLREIFPGVELGGAVPASVLAQRIAARDVLKAEMFALPVAGLLTLLFFRSAVAALLPIAIGAFALACSAAGARLAGNFAEISIFALNVSAFLGLGISIDYALLIVQRFREELPRQRSTADAVAATLDTAGRAVWVSGLTVLVSLVVLLIVPVPLLTSIAVGGMLAVASAVVGSLGLLTALLAWLGPRVNLGAVGRHPELSEPSPFWARVGDFAMRHAWLTAGGCAVLLLALAAPALRMQAVLPDARTFPLGSEVRRVEEWLANPDEFDPSGASSVQIVVAAPGPVLEAANLRRVQDYVAALRRVPGVTEVRTPLSELDPDALSSTGALRRKDPAIDIGLDRTVDREVALLVAQSQHAWRTPEAAAMVSAIRALPAPELEVSVGGATALLLDVRNTLRSHAGAVAVLVVSWNLAVLFAAFRSILVPLKAAVMNALSLAASFGVLVLVFQEGYGAGWLGFESPGGIEPTIPLVMAAIVFGLSMDYEVFLLSRIQEEYRRDGDNERSITAGLARTGRIISSAALILLVVIGAFTAGDLIYVKEIGVGMSAAIALDVTLVRALLVPATMRLLGRLNWWAPRWLGGGLTPQAEPLPMAPAVGRRAESLGRPADSASG